LPAIVNPLLQLLASIKIDLLQKSGLIPPNPPDYPPPVPLPQGEASGINV
jgi:hypothetical protein